MQVIHLLTLAALVTGAAIDTRKSDESLLVRPDFDSASSC